jgi:molecular chaperone GrpE
VVPENPENNITGLSEEAPSAVESAESVELAAQITALTKERDDLLAENAALNDRLLRRQAEFENHRRRTDRERSEYIQYAGSEVVREILPVLDDFERALKSPGADESYTKGVELIYQRLVDALKRQGLEPLDSVGKPFDPNYHQAVDREHRDDVEDQTVLLEYSRGYNFKSKLLRPAMVKVAVKA